MRVSNSSFGTQRNVLAFSSIVEVGTGVILMIDPSIAGRLLLGEDVSGVATLLGRCFGIALLALGLACWPAGRTRRADLRLFAACRSTTR